MELALIRHPRTRIAADVCVGGLDVELAAGWEAHVDRITRVLAAPDRLYSSPLQRCRHFAERLGTAHGLGPALDERLRELNFGRWEGRRWSEIDRAESDPWAADYLRAAPPGGESYEALLARVDGFLADLGSSFERVAIVAHAGSIRAILVRCLELPPGAAWKFDVGYGRLTRLAQRGGSWRLEVLNA
ncbi:MAG: alpha-ribazole phosphatase [Steroidobacteraceae bacterium]|jgi:alpha-ribazole phosphatase|nr:alpha-ribazole phosphatase [Steroidobacteraceae bacterium]